MGRADETKARVLAAARERFAADGYERATIRSIAEAASVDPALVMRYFDNKETLFVAAADFDLKLPDLRALPRGEVGAALVEHFLSRWDGDEALTALLRASASHASAVERMQTVFAEQLGTLVVALSGKRQASVRAGLVATQMLGLALCRYVVCLPSVVGLSRADVVRWLAPTIDRYLFAPVGAATNRRSVG